MKPQTLINFRVSPGSKRKYQEAAEVIGVPVSEICRKALDNAVLLAETLKTPKPNGEAPGAASPSDQEGATPSVPAINTKGVFVRKGEEWVEK